MRDWQIREAEATDLAAAFDIYYEYETHGDKRPASFSVPAYLTHVRETGRLLVAEQSDAIVGFTGLVTRDAVSFLTDFFVRPTGQSASIGRALLTTILPKEGVHCTCSTADPRALALYIRAGMRPIWPQVWLRGDGRTTAHVDHGVTHGITIEEARSAQTDRALIAWEAELGGRQRAQGLTFWREAQGGIPLWFRRGDERIGYAIIRMRGRTLRDPAAVTIGPLGVREVADAAACTLAAVEWVRQRADIYYMTVPGPHPALAPLLESGCRIEDFYTFMSNDEGAFYDPHRYISSGADLF